MGQEGVAAAAGGGRGVERQGSTEEEELLQEIEAEILERVKVRK